MMSWKYLFSLKILKNRKRHLFLSPMSLIAIFGIAFAFSSALVSLSIMNGIQKVYYQAILSFNAHMTLMSHVEQKVQDLVAILQPLEVHTSETQYWYRNKFIWEWTKKLGFFRDQKMEEYSQKGIQAMTPFIFKEGLVVMPDELKGIMIKGVDPQTFTNVYSLHFESMNQQTSTINDLLEQDAQEMPQVILGRQLWDQLQTYQNSPIIKILISKGETPTKNIQDYTQKYKVTGTFESGLYEFDSQFMLMNLEVMQKYFNLDHRVRGMEVLLDDPFKAVDVARLIEEHIPVDYQVIPWEELNEPLFSAMKIEKTLFLIIMILIILVASFNTVGVVFMIILNRQQDMIILRTLGTQNKDLRRICVLLGVILGVVGMGLGLLISFFLLWGLNQYQWITIDPKVYFISHLPVDWSWTLWVLLMGITMMISYGVSDVASRLILRPSFMLQKFR